MEPRKPQPEMKQHEESKTGRPPEGKDVGGREFGQVIEPMQAQMASGNEGLTEKAAAQAKQGERKGDKKGKAA